ncbi:MAG: NYN domain-containing protein, partial [Verrucomicrobiaceae bacterium]
MPANPNPAPSDSIALLIDADNSPAAKVDFIFSELAEHGVVNIRRAYGNWKKPALAGWERVLHQNSIQPMQNFDLVKGKNATDMSLVIDAMDILYT